MVVSELIRRLEIIKEKHGDADVALVYDGAIHYAVNVSHVCAVEKGGYREECSPFVAIGCFVTNQDEDYKEEKK